MLKTNPENKSMYINVGGQQATKEEFEKQREALLNLIAYERDADKIGEMTLKLAQINSAIVAFSAVDVATAQVETKRAQVAKAEEQLVIDNQREFESNCMLIANFALQRFNKVQQPTAMTQDEGFYNADISKYYAAIFQGLSFEAARSQANEIMSAAQSKREWKEIVSLPKPVKSQPRPTFSEV